MLKWLQDLGIDYLPFSVVKQPKFISFCLEGKEKELNKISNLDVSLDEYILSDLNEKDFEELFYCATIYVLDIFEYVEVCETEPDYNNIRIRPVWYKDLRWYREKKLERILKKNHE